MIEAIQYFNTHSLFDSISEGFSIFSTSINAIHQIATPILIKVVVTGSLFFLHPNLCSLGFVVGFVFDRHVREVVDKVNRVYNTQRSLLEKVAFFGGGGLLAILTVPTSIVIAAFYYSSQWGALLGQRNPRLSR